MSYTSIGSSCVVGTCWVCHFHPLLQLLNISIVCTSHKFCTGHFKNKFIGFTSEHRAHSGQKETKSLRNTMSIVDWLVDLFGSAWSSEKGLEAQGLDERHFIMVVIVWRLQEEGGTNLFKDMSKCTPCKHDQTLRIIKLNYVVFEQRHFQCCAKTTQQTRSCSTLSVARVHPVQWALSGRHR